MLATIMEIMPGAAIRVVSALSINLALPAFSHLAFYESQHVLGRNTAAKLQAQ